MDMRRPVGQNVRRIRQNRGLTQAQFAEISGFSQQYLSGLEKGKRNPTIVTVFELASALGVSHMYPSDLDRRRRALTLPMIRLRLRGARISNSTATDRRCGLRDSRAVV
jgi:transcriptional regulator with XRE-family HTH domain